MLYHGIELDLPKGKVQLTHSIALDIIQKQSSSKNMDWTDKLGQLPWGLLKDEYYQGYDNVCKLFSMIHMDYQICNGGIEQYFYNGYHNGKPAHHEDDVALYDIDVQKRQFSNLVQFAHEIYPNRTVENSRLAAAANAFQLLSYEEDAEVMETVYCDEDEYIYDEETGERVENPDYFEPYDEPTYENVIHGGDGFNDIFYEASDYLEELLELRAQFYCKLFSRDLEIHAEEHPELTAVARNVLGLPDELYGADLSSRIQAAQSKTEGNRFADTVGNDHDR